MTILPYLETFSAVVENGSFTAAADALGISKPVVSKQVSQLEKHLGVQLLQRTTRRLNLEFETWAGSKTHVLHLPIETTARSCHYLAFKLCDTNEAQRILRPNVRLVSGYLAHCLMYLPNTV